MVTVVQGKIVPTDTGEDMTNWSNPANGKVFHNGTQIIRFTRAAGTASTLKFWYSDGTEADTKALAASNVLDCCYNSDDDKYYTIRFGGNDTNTVTVASWSMPDTDDFTTVSGTTGFNASRWNEPTGYTDFTRSIALDKLAFYGGTGRLVTTYELSSAVTASLDVEVSDVDSDAGRFELQLRALKDSNTPSIYDNPIYPEYMVPIASCGVGEEGGQEVMYSLFINGYSNYTADSYLYNFRFNKDAAVSGTETIRVYCSQNNAGAGGVWTVSGTLSGYISSMTTNSSGAGTFNSGPVAFSMANVNGDSGDPNVGEYIDIVINYFYNPQDINSTELSLSRSGATMTLPFKSTSCFTDEAVVAIDGYGTMTVLADNFTASGTCTAGTQSTYYSPYFVIEEINILDGSVTSTLVTKFAPSTISGTTAYSYTDFSGTGDSTYDGRVLMTCDSLVATNVIIKVDSSLYKYAVSSFPLGTEDGSNAVISSTGEIAAYPIPGKHFEWCGASNPLNGFITYSDYDDTAQMEYVYLIDDDTLVKNTSYKLVLNDSSDQFYFWNHSDYNTLYYIDDSDNSLYSYSTDASLAAFIGMEVDDATMPAGTGDTSNVTARVINCYGQALQSKTVNFSVSAGDGAVSPDSDTTDANGEASSQYTVGASTGVATITATVTES